jgi:hypothetical protein
VSQIYLCPILVPDFRPLKEWAYAGYFFAMSGAVFSHVASGDSIYSIAPALFLLIVIVVSRGISDLRIEKSIQLINSVDQ